MLSILLALGAADGRLAVASLAVEHLIAPEGIDVTAPRFSWHLVAPTGARGVVPLASQLQLSTEPDFIASSLVMNATARGANLLSGASSEQLTARGRAAVAWEVRAAGELRLNVTVPPGCVGEVDVLGNASELVVSESGVVLWRRGAAAGTAEGVTAVAALADGVRLSTVSGSYMVVAE